MKNLFVILLVVFSLSELSADAPLPPPEPNKDWSGNRRYETSSDPRGETTCTDLKTKKELWKIPQWFRWSFISNDGVHLVTGFDGLNLIPLDYKDDLVLLTFWENGKKTRDVTLGELIPDKSILEKTVSHYHWGSIKGFTEDGNLQISLADNKKVFYDVATGKKTEPKLKSGTWPDVPYKEVRAYAWPGDKTTKAVILENNELLEGVLNKGGTPLSSNQVKWLLSAVNGNHYAHPVAACYRPHNAFVFYDESNKPIAFVEICFGCLSYRSEPRGAADSFDLMTLAVIFDELKLPLGEYTDLEAFKKPHWEMLNPEVLAEQQKQGFKLGEESKAKEKLLVGKWKSKDDVVTLQFLRDGIYVITSSSLDSKGELMTLPRHLGGLRILRDRGYWTLGGTRLNMTWADFPQDGASSGFDVTELTSTKLSLKFSKDAPMEFERVP
jgi:hypothetical protein